MFDNHIGSNKENLFHDKIIYIFDLNVIDAFKIKILIRACLNETLKSHVYQQQKHIFQNNTRQLDNYTCFD